MIIRLIAAATMALFTLLIPSPAQSADPTWGPYAEPQMVAPWSPEHGDVLRIQLQAPRHAWGIRPEARKWAESLPDVRIYRHGKCSDRPWARCLVVRKVEDADVDWMGIMRVHSGDVRVITLNTYWTGPRHYRASTTCHEIGHALGLSHHRDAGCIGDGVVNLETEPSAVEIAALDATY